MKFPQKLRIRTFGDSVLRAHNEDIIEITPELLAFSDLFINKMYSLKGIGLAAPQIGINLNMIVIDPPLPETVEDLLDENKDMELDEAIEKAPLSAGEKLILPLCPVVLVNPRILSRSGITDIYEEGCLSFPKIYGKVERPLTITLKAQLLSGEEFVTEVSGFSSRVIQHEVDHLNGVLLVDRFTEETRQKLAPSLDKLEGGNQLDRIKKLLRKRT